EVYETYKKTLQGRYPFHNKGPDAAIADVTDFLKDGGVLQGFYAQNMAKALAKAGPYYRPQKPYDKTFSGTFIRCLEDADYWRAGLLNGAAPGFEIEMKPYGISNVGEIVLEVDGKKFSYRNGPEPTWKIHWP